MSSTSVKTVCPYCGVGCGMVLHVEDGQVVKISGDKEHPSNFGRLCTKGQSAHVALRKSGRLESAFVRHARDEDPVPLPMAQAISTTAARLRGLLDEHGPDALSFYVSGQMSIEAQYLVNKLAKGFVGTNNIESNSRLCMASAGSGYKLSLGADGPPGSYEDIDHADLFFVIGANMADCHPILFLRMMDRVKAGAKLIVVDPRRNATAEKADLFMQIKPGTDLALLNGLLHLLHENGHTDAAFIAEATEGWDAMPAFLADYTPEHVAQITGLAAEDIRRAAQMIGSAKEWISCWTMGLNQSTHGTWHTNAICNLHLATGKICRRGSGPFSLTGQPNAMGGREMGYMGPGLPGQRSVLVEADRAFIEDLWGIAPGTLKTEVGNGTIDMFTRMAAGDIKACWIICTNPVASVANRQNVIAGLRAAELVIAQDAFLDTETNRYADVLLPGALWAEARRRDDQLRAQPHADAKRHRATGRRVAGLADHRARRLRNGFCRCVQLCERRRSVRRNHPRVESENRLRPAWRKPSPSEGNAAAMAAAGRRFRRSQSDSLPQRRREPDAEGTARRQPSARSCFRPRAARRCFSRALMRRRLNCPTANSRSC